MHHQNRPIVFPVPALPINTVFSPVDVALITPRSVPVFLTQQRMLATAFNGHGFDAKAVLKLFIFHSRGDHRPEGRV